MELDRTGDGARVNAEFETGDEAYSVGESPRGRGGSVQPSNAVSDFRGLSTRVRQPQNSALAALPNDLLRYLAAFFADQPHTLMRMAATCFPMRKGLDREVRDIWNKSSTNADSMRTVEKLLRSAGTGGDLFSPKGTRQPFRSELLATLGSRILALSHGDRDKARLAFIAAARACPEPRTAALKNALDAAQKGIDHLKSVEEEAVASSLPACRTCEDLAAVQRLAAQLGICSAEGLTRMKSEAADHAVSNGASWEQACERFGVPAKLRHAQWELGEEEDYGARPWTDFFE